MAVLTATSIGLVTYLELEIEHMADEQKSVLERNVKTNLEIREAQIEVMNIGRLVNRSVFEDDSRDLAALKNDLAKAVADAALNLREAKDRATAESTRTDLDFALKELSALEPLAGKVSELAIANDRSGAAKLVNDTVSPTMAKLRQRLDATVTASSDRMLARSAEIEQEVDRAQQTGFAVLLISILSSVGFGLAIAFGGISGPIVKLTEALRNLADGKWDTEVPGTDRGDELGAMAKTAEVFKANGQQNVRMVEEQRRQAEAIAARKATVDNAVAQFGQAASSVISGLAAASTELEGSIQSLSATAEESSASTQTVAAAGQEMSASIAEIGRQTSTSARLAEQAVKEVDHVGQATQELTEASKRIGEVVSLIADVAEQTNLLALNATIEAARAGDAGRGFAVVASEVKTLASQTSKATEEIAHKIADMQAATERAVGAVRAVAERINEIGTATTTIAGAVEEQDVTTREIAKNIQDAAAGATEVARSNGSLLAAAGTVSREAETLKHEFDQFLAKVKAA